MLINEYEFRKVKELQIKGVLSTWIPSLVPKLKLFELKDINLMYASRDYSTYMRTIENKINTQNQAGRKERNEG